jgi:hypothetical protein
MRLKRRRLPDVLELPYRFDIAALQDDVRRKIASADWNGLQNEYAQLCSTFRKELESKFEVPEQRYQQIAFTELDPESTNVRGDLHLNEDERNYTRRNANCTELWARVLDTFRARPTRCRLARMHPGSSIKPHIDYDTDYSIRVHIPIMTNDGSFFFVRRRPSDEPARYHLPADGRCWFINQGFIHWVENNGDTDRIHLILSLDGQEDLEGLIERTGNDERD